MDDELEMNYEQLKNSLFKMIMSFIILAISVAFGGYVTMYLWNDIITPIFHVFKLTWPQATGIDLFIGFLAGQRNSKQDKTLVYLFLYTVLSNLLFMLIGWIIMMFI